jgi:peptidyl-prolyl cis-trans isomerase C
MSNPAIKINISEPDHTASGTSFHIQVNGVEIKEADVFQEAQHHPAEDEKDALFAAARALVVRELLSQESKALGIVSIPESDSSGTSETLEEATIRTLLDSEVDVPVADPDECRQFYDNNPRKFESEPLYEARHILLAVSADDSAKRKELRNQTSYLIERLKDAPGQFSDMARELSDCPSGKVGGSLGQLTRGSTVREFEQAMSKMGEGELSSKPVESRYGFHIIYLDRRISGSVLPFESVQERISAWLGAAAWSKAVSQYISILIGKATITGINLDAADGPLVQ